MATDQNRDHRIQFIQSIDEDAFRKIVLLPLLTHLGYREVIEYHGGSAEKGKDIICWYHDPMERRRHVALVVKRGDIHGAVGKAGNASEIMYQVQQALNEPYRDIYELSELRIDECIVVATGQIKNSAIESISGSMSAGNLDRIMQFMDQRRVVDLITRHMPQFWMNDQYTLMLLHELRAPLSSIAASASRLMTLGKKEPVDASRLLRTAERIAADAETAHLLAERQYELRSPGSHVSPHEMEVRPELETAVSEFRRLFMRGDRHKITLEASDCLGRAHLDRRALRLAMYNLLENAVRFGERQSEIKVLAVRAPPHVIIRVRNEGIGIDADHEEAVFQPFYTHSSDRPGLGLYVARGLVEGMGGQIRLTNRSAPTEFSIYLSSAGEPSQ